jgi:acyl dehydratase
MGQMGFPMEQTDNERMLNYGLDRVRFTDPVLSGDRVRARLVLTDLVPRKEGVDLAKVRLTYETERKGSSPHMIADALMLVVHGPAIHEAR